MRAKEAARWAAAEAAAAAAAAPPPLPPPTEALGTRALAIDGARREEAGASRKTGTFGAVIATAGRAGKRGNDDMRAASAADRAAETPPELDDAEAPSAASSAANGGARWLAAETAAARKRRRNMKASDECASSVFQRKGRRVHAQRGAPGEAHARRGGELRQSTSLRLTGQGTMSQTSPYR